MLKGSATPSQPLEFDRVPGIKVTELHGDFGRAQFRAAQRELEIPLHVLPWADTEKEPRS